MHFEELSKYIIPALFLLYFFSGKKKKSQAANVQRRPSEPSHSEAKEPLSISREQHPWERTEGRLNPPLPPRSSQMEARSFPSSCRQGTSPAPHCEGSPNLQLSSQPSVQRKLARMESAITTRHFQDGIEERSYVSSISDERAQGLVSVGLNEHINIDQAYALKSRHKISRGGAILNQLASPREAFVLQVIINRYDSE